MVHVALDATPPQAGLAGVGKVFVLYLVALHLRRVVQYLPLELQHVAEIVAEFDLDVVGDGPAPHCAKFPEILGDTLRDVEWDVLVGHSPL